MKSKDRYEAANELVRQSGVNIDEFVVAVNGTVETRLVTDDGEFVRDPSPKEMGFLFSLLNSDEIGFEELFAAFPADDEWMFDSHLVDFDEEPEEANDAWDLDER